jgi:hypothetical protein
MIVDLSPWGGLCPLGMSGLFKTLFEAGTAPGAAGRRRALSDLGKPASG